MGSYNPLVFVLGLVTAAGVTGVAYLLALARGGESRVLGREYGPIFVALGLFARRGGGGPALLYEVGGATGSSVHGTVWGGNRAVRFHDASSGLLPLPRARA